MEHGAGAEHWFGWGWYSWVPLLQVACLVHCLVTRRSWFWILVILFAPAIGAIVYLVVEVLPTLRRRPLRGVEFPMPRGVVLRRAERRLEEEDTVENRAALAELHAQGGDHERARELLQPCLQGPLRKHPYLLYASAAAHFASGEHDGALELLGRIDELNTSAKKRERRLLRARIREARGDLAGAEADYREAKRGFDGEEAEFRYVAFLEHAGRHDEALAAYRALLDEVRRAPWRYRRQEQVWIREAGRRAAALARGA